jgi:pimeloyl-ACP methyl ester carboxylesterase
LSIPPVAERPFELEIGDGVLRGHRAETGPPALLLHGGPAMPDYLGPVAAELDGLLATIRYTQRGTLPTTVGPPFTIESHAADAIAVLDGLGIERAWAVGHSWGGHLALFLAIWHPERLLGLICIDPLGAFNDVFADQDRRLRGLLTPEQAARVEEVEELRRRGEATEGDLLERLTMIWPNWFADPTAAPPHGFEHLGPEASRRTNASLAQHFEAGTLAGGLPTLRLPALFVHGELDALPPRASEATAALIPGARVEILPGLGHFPWLEQPGAVRAAVEPFLAAQ